MKPTTRERWAFTLIEMLVVIGIIGILMAILLPVISTAKESGRVAFCGNNLSQIGKALQMYCDEHNDTLPPVSTAVGGGITWDTNLLAYLAQNVAVFRCPSDPYLASGDPVAPRTYAANNKPTGADGNWIYPFGGYGGTNNAPVRMSALDFRNSDNRYANSDIIMIGERPGLSSANRGHVGAFAFCGLDQGPSTIHKKGTGANYLMGSGAVRFYQSNDVMLVGTTNLWLVSEQ